MNMMKRTPTCRMAAGSSMTVRNRSVVIVGAGIAGIAAANHLIKAGFTNVTVYEATEQIGGRIRTAYFKDHHQHDYRLELGAQWIHGCHGNPIFSIAKKNALLVPLWQREPSCESKSICTSQRGMTRGCAPLTESGKHVETGLMAKVIRKFRKYLQECEDYSNAHPESGTDSSVWEYVYRAMDTDYLGQFKGNERRLREAILEQKHAMECAIDGCDTMENLSLWCYDLYQSHGGGDPVVDQGYIKVVQALADELPQGTINLDSPIRRVDWTQCTASSKVTPGDAKVDLHVREQASCSDKIVEADHVIITCSLGCLKHHIESEVYTPALPADKLEAIKCLGIDTVDKIFLKFENLDFFADLPTRLFLVWDVSDPLFNKDRTGENWTRRIADFEIMNTAADDTIIIWMVGKEAAHMETLTDEEVANGCLTVLKKFLHNPNVPQPLSIVRSKWSTEPYTRGSYSFHKVGSTKQHRLDLAEPILDHTSKPVITFAGEACHPTYFSTTHGALLSGQQAAQKLVDFYKCSK